jgi:hypothetical protein
MAREPNPERAHRMFRRILEDLDARPEPGPWLNAARTLSERLIISEDTLYYLAEMLTECIVFTASSTDPQLVSIGNEVEAIERAHGLGEDGYWHRDEAPEDWRRLNEDWERRADEIVNACLRETGHADLAALREKNRGDFDGRTAKGRTDLWGEDEDDDA